MDSNINERFVLVKAVEKAVKPAVKDATADMKAELLRLSDESGVDRVVVKIGDTKTKVTLVNQETKKLVGSGDEFVQFMADHGMTQLVVSNDWVNEVVEHDGKIIWAETGEVVPGAGYEIAIGASYPRVSGLDAEAVLKAARDEHLLDPVIIPMLEEPNGD